VQYGVLRRGNAVGSSLHYGR